MKKITAQQTLTVAILIALVACTGGAGIGRALYIEAKRRIKKKIKDHERAEVKESIFRATLSRLKRQGLVENTSWGVWGITNAGRRLLARYNEKPVGDFRAEFAKKHSGFRDTIIIFDVPESRRKLRDYLRIELVALGYTQLQKSVWIGGGPLPEEFMHFLKKSELLNTVHIFSIRERGTIL